MLHRKPQTFTRGRTPVAAQNTIIVQNPTPQAETVEVESALNLPDSSATWKTSVGMARPSKFTVKVPQQKTFAPKNN
jgi:hypothetical protein